MPGMIMDGGGGSLFDPIGGGASSNLGTQIRDDSQRATVTDIQQKLEEIRRMLSGLRPETIATQGSGTEIKYYTVLASPAGTETIEVPEDAPMNPGETLLDWFLRQLEALRVDLEKFTNDAVKEVADSLAGVKSTVDKLDRILDPTINGSIGFLLAGFHHRSITLCEDGTPKTVTILTSP